MATMRRFLASAWFPFSMCLVFAGVSVAAYVGLDPTGDDIGNGQILKIAGIAAWGIGPVAALLSWLGIAILNLVRRIIRIRRVGLLHPVVVLIGIGPWLVFSWILTGEPRYTPVARAVIDFAARELLWGSLVACVLTIVLSMPLLFRKKK